MIKKLYIRNWIIETKFNTQLHLNKSKGNWIIRTNFKTQLNLNKRQPKNVD